MMLMSLRIEYCCFPDRDKRGQDGGEEEDEVKDEKEQKSENYYHLVIVVRLVKVLWAASE